MLTQVLALTKESNRSETSLQENLTSADLYSYIVEYKICIIAISSFISAGFADLCQVLFLLCINA